MKLHKHDALGVAVVAGSALAAGLRFTVPGHELSALGTLVALLFIASGSFLAMAAIQQTHDPADSTSLGQLSVLMIPESYLAFVILGAVAWFFGVCLLAFHVPGEAAAWPVVFEMLAHLWVGALIAIAWWHWPTRLSAVTWASLAAITLIETLAFLNRG